MTAFRHVLELNEVQIWTTYYIAS